MRTWNPSEDRLISSMDWKLRAKPKPKLRTKPRQAVPVDLSKPVGKPKFSNFQTVDLSKAKPVPPPLQQVDPEAKARKYDKKIQDLREKLKSLKIPEQKAFYHQQILKYAEKRLKLKLNFKSVAKSEFIARSGPVAKPVQLTPEQQKEAKLRKYDQKIKKLQAKVESLEIPEQRAFYEKQISKYVEKKAKLKLDPKSVVTSSPSKLETQPKKKAKSPMSFWNTPKVVKILAEIKKAEGGPKRGFQHNLKMMLDSHNKKNPQNQETAPEGLLS